MSFDVYLQHFERGLPAEADRAAVGAVLRGLEATGPDTSGHYHVRVNDLWTLVKSRHSPVTELEIVGASEAVPGPGREPYILAISVGDLEAEEEFRGCAFFLHAFSPGIAEVIFRIAEAGGMAINPGGRNRATTSAHCRTLETCPRTCHRRTGSPRAPSSSPFSAQTMGATRVGATG